MEARQVQIIGGQVSAGTEGNDPPKSVSVRIALEVAGNPIDARGVLKSPELVNGFIYQLTRMRDEVWGQQSGNAVGKAVGSVETVHQPTLPEEQRWGIAVSGHVVHSVPTQDLAGRIVSKLRGRLQANERMPAALIGALQDVG